MKRVENNSETQPPNRRTCQTSTISLSDELRQLEELHQRGTLTDDEFAQAKARVLSLDVSSAQKETPIDGASEFVLDTHLRHIQQQNELARLDREWELERENYLVAHKDGSRQIPNAGGNLAVCLIAALVIIVFGLFWTIGASSAGAPAFFPLFGVFFIVVGGGSFIAAGISGFSKAEAYQQTEEAYQVRRQQLLEKSDTNPVGR